MTDQSHSIDNGVAVAAPPDDGHTIPGMDAEGVHAADQRAEPRAVTIPPESVHPQVDLASLSIDALSTSEEVYFYELSWLDFNWRVLSEACDARNPLLERLKFIAIAASNLDEFFSKRIGGLRRQDAVGLHNLKLEGLTPAEKLGMLSRAVRPMIERQSDCLLNEILPGLAEHGVELHDYVDCTPEQQALLDDHFVNVVYPTLTPLAVGPRLPLPLHQQSEPEPRCAIAQPRHGRDVFLAPQGARQSSALDTA